MQRRRFLKTAAAATALTAARRAAQAQQQSDNEQVNVGLIGCGGRGRFVAARMAQVPGVKFVAVCDVYERNMGRAQEWAGEGCRAFKDFRELLDQRDVDAVLVGTPDHWHAIPTVLACRAGKDVYVEKPISHNVREGRAMIRAAREHNRVVQAGTQQRSAAHFDHMREIVQSGKLGKVHYIRIWNYRNSFPRGIGRREDADVPAGVDWDFYLGPAPLVPFNPNRFLGSFRWFWDYAGGLTTDWGTHRFDSMLQVMGPGVPADDGSARSGESSGRDARPASGHETAPGGPAEPQAITASGGRFELRDGTDTPDVLQVTYEFPDFVLSYEANALCAHGGGFRTPGRAYYRANGTHDRPNGLAFYGTNGAMFADRLGFEIYPEVRPGVSLRRYRQITPDLFRMEPQEGSSGDSTYLHAENFIQCVRSRQQPAADIAIGHRASTIAHLGNLAFRTRRKLLWDSQQEEFTGDPEASALLGRDARKPWDII